MNYKQFLFFKTGGKKQNVNKLSKLKKYYQNNISL